MNFDDLIAFAISHVGVHWPFIAVATVLGFLMELLKTRVPKELAAQKRWAFWVRAIMPFLAPLTGVLLGSFQLVPVPAMVVGRFAAALYFGVAGVVCSWVYDAVRHYIQKQAAAKASPPPAAP